ncbi:MAG: heavy-metal-associated domain-containing protein, partial [Planctomycetaceae bacterium]|nr:heavy-metal-associated domain-containing protein [Planctomycetaceae bacterium]
MKATYEVQGMHCGSCAAKVAGAIREIPGVRRADVTIASRRADVEAEAPLDLDQLNQAVSRVGDYRVVAPTPHPIGAGSSAEHAGDTVEDTEPHESLYPLFLIVGY